MGTEPAEGIVRRGEDDGLEDDVIEHDDIDDGIYDDGLNDDGIDNGLDDDGINDDVLDDGLDGDSGGITAGAVPESGSQ
jgi:hypothetical protein